MVTSLSNIDVNGISIVIVTYNGAKRLPATLKHLAHQENINFPLELLLIDNKSTDGTADLVAGHWLQLDNPFPLRIVQENRAGTMYARERGISEAGYRYLLYCDDDNWLAPDYVASSYQLIVQNPQIAVLGGRGHLVFEEGFQVPGWLQGVSNYYGAGPQGKKDGDTTFDKGCLYTAGATLDRLWLHKLYQSGFQSVLTGRQGNSLIAGEDTELTYALVVIGAKLHYSEKLVFRHFMTPNRITWSYFLRLSYAFGYSNFVLKTYRRPREKSFFMYAMISVLLIVKYKLLHILKGSKEGDMNACFAAKFNGQWQAIKKSKQTDITINHFLKLHRNTQ